MGELFMELKPLGVVAAVVAIVWLTAISAEPPRRETVFEERYAEVTEPARDSAGWPEGWGLVNVDVEAE